MEDPRIISTQFNSPKMPYYNVLVNTEVYPLTPLPPPGRALRFQIQAWRVTVELLAVLYHPHLYHAG